MIVIVDYGMGNLRSVENKLQRMGLEVRVSAEPRVVGEAQKLILPGVGSFAEGMRRLGERGLIEALNRKVLEKKTPVLGICLGMQLMSAHSEEGDVEGLGWIGARTRRLRPKNGPEELPVPHVGWSRLRVIRPDPLLDGLDAEAAFYFTHSYHVVCEDGSDVLAVTRYGADFTSVIRKGHIMGTQFHPEKSRSGGMRIIQNFAGRKAGPLRSGRSVPRPRVIPCLLVREGGLVKGERFKNHRYVGDPLNAARIFNSKSADELIVLNISSAEVNQPGFIELVSRISDECFMPVTAGGGIRSMDQIRKLFSAGAEKVSLNTAAHEVPDLIREASDAFGRQSIVVSIDVKKNWFGRPEVYVRNGSKGTGLDPVRAAERAQHNGAGEILLGSIDRDGVRQGYDLGLIRRVREAVDIPVIAVGGAGSVADFARVIHAGGASAAAAGSLFVFHGRRKAVLIHFPVAEELTEMSGAAS